MTPHTVTVGGPPVVNTLLDQPENPNLTPQKHHFRSEMKPLGSPKVLIDYLRVMRKSTLIFVKKVENKK